MIPIEIVNAFLRSCWLWPSAVDKGLGGEL